EDGIRDFHVTGVQTCALPILHAFDVAIATQARAAASDEEEVDCELPLGSIDPAFCTALARLGPFGMGFAPPRFWVDPVRVEAVRDRKSVVEGKRVGTRGCRGR